MKKLLSFLMLIDIILCGINLVAHADANDQVIEDAKLLYTKIHEFLDTTKDCPPEDFDKVCVDYMLKKSDPLTVLDKDAFEAQTKSAVKLYRGVPKKEFADDMKMGKFYIGSGISNVRGSGIYTTTSVDCANHYTDGTGEVITLAMNNDAKVVEMSYLKQVICKMREMYPEEFKCTLEDDLLYDSMGDWIATQMKDYFKDDYDTFLLGEVPDESIKLACNYMRAQPDFSKLVENRKKYYKNKIAAIFYNRGLSAKLLGYDVLHSVASLRDFFSQEEEEYLILNAGVLWVCK